MRFDRTRFRELFTALGYDRYARTVGFPSQIFVENLDQMLWSIGENYGVNPCHVSHNSYPKLKILNKKVVPNVLTIERVPFDFENSKDKTNKKPAFEDACMLAKILNADNFPVIFAPTGGAGYHVYIKLEAKTFKFENDKSINAAKDIVRLVQLYFRDRLKLTTLDGQIISDVKRILKVPYCPYVKLNMKKGIVENRIITGKYTSIIPQELLPRATMDDIEEYIKEPEFYIPNFEGKRKMDITELCNFFNIKLISNTRDRFDDRVERDIVVDTGFKFYIDEIEKVYPCIINGMKKKNPEHNCRLAFALICKNMLNMDRNSFEQLYIALGESVGYIDLENVDRRQEQINYIWDAENLSGLYGYKKIAKMGYCFKGCTRKCTARNGGVVNG